jgi:hypothetical protein
LKQGDALLSLLLNFDLKYVIRRVQVNQDGLKLNMNKLLVYAADDNILGGNIHTIKKSTEALVLASKGTGLKVTAEKTTYMIMSEDQHAGKYHDTK